MDETKASKTKLNTIKNKTNCSTGLKSEEFYYGVWCNETYYLQNNPWYISQHDTLDMQDAAKIFVEQYDKEWHTFFAKICSEINNIVIFVQDWRGRIAKFEILIETKPVYIVRRIT